MNNSTIDFSSFLGRTVKVKEDTYTYKDKTYTDPSIAAEETVIQEIATIANIHDHNQIRIWFPDGFGTMELRSDRLNIVINKDNDQWVITKIYWG